MARAIKLAEKGWFTTRANPRVGCVIAKDSEVLAEGWHQKAGLNHAEVNAISNASNSAQQDLSGTTAYVTLEPCCHFGKRPPCALALVQAGITRVVCAMQDPNPLVSGQGIELLQKAGVEVEVGLLEAAAQQLNVGFVKRMIHGLPKVTIKMATSLDGKIAMASGESQWITGQAARADVQRLRAESCAIITGSASVIADNPSMNVRDPEFLSNEYFAQPLRVVIDSQGLVDADAKIFQLEGEAWLATTQWQNKEYPAGVNQEVFEPTADGKVDLYELLLRLADKGINQVLVEAGSGLAAAFIKQQLADELVVYMAPKLMGATAQSMLNLPFTQMAQSIALQLEDTRVIGEDLKLTYNLVKKR